MEIGTLLFNWLPEADYIRCARAMTELYQDHGDSKNHMQTRIFTIAQQLGKEKFVQLFKKYFGSIKKTKTPLYTFNESAEDCIAKLKSYPIPTISETNYNDWKKLSVSPAKVGSKIVSVLLRYPYGKLRPSLMEKIVDLTDRLGLHFVRLTQDKNLLLPLVHTSALPEVYNFINNESNDIDLSLKSFSGHIHSCIGPAVCKQGVLDTTDITTRIALKLDALFKDKQQQKVRFANEVLKMIRVSGCPNSCGGHRGASIGIQGLKNKGKPCCKLFLDDGNDKFEQPIQQDGLLGLDEMADKVLGLLINKFKLNETSTK
ncbi:MAG: hypothetical protein GY750_08260 [Lentisphaerae bacterium]|nr:hypothetical protein [Lentisphaerota bacterium]MCP4101402.1 hypothetical protein [Lentisphaerota bacterium]